MTRNARCPYCSMKLYTSVCPKCGATLQQNGQWSHGTPPGIQVSAHQPSGQPKKGSNHA
jgi:hypothetical protein